MFYYQVAPNRVVFKSKPVFTYQFAAKLQPGQIVTIPVGRRTLIGVIIKAVKQPDFDTKPIASVLENRPLPTPLLKTILWLADYYASDLATVLQTTLPSGLDKTRRQTKTKPLPTSATAKLSPTAAQAKAIKGIADSPVNNTILHGVTGSGKTTVYLELAAKTIAAGQSVIIIVPEIALTTQLIQQVRAYFDAPLIVHSKITEAKRHLIWQTALNADQPVVVVGARSALFTPAPNLGLIVIDEFHEPSLKQDRNPRYSAVRTASYLAHQTGAKLILGSATPDTTEHFIYEQKNYSIIKLTSTALLVTKPKIEVVDMTKKANFKRHYFLSNQLLTAIKQSLTNQEQVLLYHNRRGTASTTICKDCGWMAECDHCHIPMSLHADHFQLICHSCGTTAKVPTTCLECGSTNVDHRGIGTKLIEREVKKLFPSTNIKRFDADTASDQTVDQMYEQLQTGKVDIIIGTQVIAKGLNLPKLTTVGVVQADSGLFLPDFTSEERTFQLLSQVIGRVGRDQKTTTVVVQTYQPEHPSIQFGINQDFTNFYQYCLRQRKIQQMPPFRYLLRLKVSYKTEAAVIKHITQLATDIKRHHPQVSILGPTPCFYERTGDKINWQIIVKSVRRPVLQQIIANLPANTSIQYDIDPMSLL